MMEVDNSGAQFVSQEQMEDIEAKGITLSCVSDAFSELEFDVRLADHGIGPYEYWGCKGVDRRIGPDGDGCVELEWVQLEDEPIPEPYEFHYEFESGFEETSTCLITAECEKTIEETMEIAGVRLKKVWATYYWNAS